jgi:hypothetical protein
MCKTLNSVRSYNGTKYIRDHSLVVTNLNYLAPTVYSTLELKLPSETPKHLTQTLRQDPVLQNIYANEVVTHPKFVYSENNVRKSCAPISESASCIQITSICLQLSWKVVSTMHKLWKLCDTFSRSNAPNEVATSTQSKNTDPPDSIMLLEYKVMNMA